MADHPVEVPPELMRQWYNEAVFLLGCGDHVYLANRAAQWGADQQLEKVRELAEQTTTALHAIASGANDVREQRQYIAILAAALNRLAELEANQ